MSKPDSQPHPPETKSASPLTAKRGLRAKRRGFFVRGLAVLLPTILTVFLFTTVWNFVQRHVVGPINGTIYGLLEGNGLGWIVLGAMDIDPYARQFLNPEELPPELSDRIEEFGGLGSAPFQAALTAWRGEEETFLRAFDDLAIDAEKLREAVAAEVHPAVGLVLSAVLVLFLGYLASGFLGRSLIAGFDRTLHRIPLVRSVYPSAKQLVEFFMSESELEFDTVVAAPYPAEGIWSIGFLTGNGLRDLNHALEDRMASIFIPTSPMPMTGFTVYIEESRLIPLDITVDEALRICVSAGVLVPQNQVVQDLAQRAQGAA